MAFGFRRTRTFEGCDWLWRIPLSPRCAGVLFALLVLFAGDDSDQVFGDATVRLNESIGVSRLLASLATRLARLKP